MAGKNGGWGPILRFALMGLLLLGAACNREPGELVHSTIQATEVDEQANCFTDANCGLYACGSEHDCNTSCARDSDCGISRAFCDQETVFVPRCRSMEAPAMVAQAAGCTLRMVMGASLIVAATACALQARSAISAPLVMSTTVLASTWTMAMLARVTPAIRTRA